MLTVLIMSATVFTALLYFERTFKQNISRDQFALLDAVASQIDERIFDALVDLDTLAGTLTPAMIADPTQAQRILDRWKTHQAFFDNTLFLFSRSGQLVAASPRELNLIGKDYSFRNYFKETIGTGKICISPPFDSIQKKSHPVIMFTAPVYDDTGGKIIAVVGGAVGLKQQHYFRSLAALKLGRNGYLSLYDTSRTVLIHPNSSRLLVQDPPGANMMVDKSLQGYEGTAETVARSGIPVLRSVTHLKSTDWVLALSYPLKDAYAPLYAVREIFRFGVILAALLSALLVWQLMKYLTAPLLTFTRHLEQLPSMEGAQRLVPIRSNDEIGLMGHAFNRMIVELKKTEQELERSRDFYLTLFENFPTFIWRSGTNAKCNYFNRTWLDFTGRTLEEELGDGWTKGVHPDDLESCVTTYLEAFHDRKSFAREYRLRHHDGKYRWLRDYGNPFNDLEGNFAGYIGSCYDVTERKHYEDALHLSEERYRAIYNGVGDIIYTISSEASFTSLNRAFEEITRWQASQWVGRSFVELLCPKDLPLVREVFERCLQGKTVSSFEFRIRTNSGEYVELEANATPLVLDGNVISVQGIARDVSQRNQADKALRESEKRYRHLFENNPHPMWVFDLETFAFLAVNDATVRHYGYSREEFLAMTIKDIRPPEDVPALLTDVAKVADGIDSAGVWRHITKDGAVIFVEITSHTMKFGGKDAKIVLAHDITDRLGAAKEKQALEQQLRQAQKMEAIGTLAGGIAHDFNNILTAIVGYATLLQRKIGKENPCNRQVNRILDAAERAAGLTQSLLAYGRKQISNPHVVELSSIVSGASHLLRRLIPESIEFKTFFAEETLTVMADAGQIEQVLMNLVVNARDAMPEGGDLRITTGLALLDEDFVATHGYGCPGRHALLTIADTGIGMDDKTRERAFEPFFTTKEVGKGSGLGLAMVYGIVKQHNGYINCYSEPGHGTVFRIYLPMVGGMAAKSVLPGSQTVAGGNETILLVEDDDDVRELTKDLLEEVGYRVITAVDGQDAVEKFAHHHDAVQLVILDIIMPKMSGKEAYNRIVEMAPEVRVIFVSGYTADVVTGNILINNDCAVLAKPINPKDLLSKVRTILDGL